LTPLRARKYNLAWLSTLSRSRGLNLSFLNPLLANRPLLSAVVAWASAQVLKLVLFSILERRLYWRRLIDTGGLPSAHSAFVMGLATGVGIHDGVESSVFAIAAVFAAVVMYDAVSLRREAGKHADILNELLLLSFIRDAFKEREALKELIGHTPLEVMAGAALGIAMAFLLQ
jgi:acid phosphatase family membrane protein YuiD